MAKGRGRMAEGASVRAEGKGRMAEGKYLRKMDEGAIGSMVG